MILGAPINAPLGSGVRKRLDRALVVGTRALRNEVALTVTLIVGNRGHRRVDRKLLVVDTKTVAVGVRVREETRLQNWVGRRFAKWNSVRRREGSLFNHRS